MRSHPQCVTHIFPPSVFLSFFTSFHLFICQACCVVPASCSGSTAVSPPGEFGPPHFTLANVLLLICSHAFAGETPCGLLKAATQEQKLCPLGCTNRPSLIKLSCSSDLADGYFHCWATSCNEIWSQSGGMWHTHTHTQIESVGFPLGGSNSRQVRSWCVYLRVFYWSSGGRCLFSGQRAEIIH